MYSTHFIATPLCMDMSFLKPCLPSRGRGGGRRRESVPVSSGVSSKEIKNKKQKKKPQKTKLASNSTIQLVKCQFCCVFHVYPSKMAILLTQENMFHHE